MTSYQIAFSTPKESASPVPSIQLKYHMDAIAPAQYEPVCLRISSSVMRPRSTLNTQVV